MKTTACLCVLVLLAFSFVTPVVAGFQEPLGVGDRDYPACVSAREEQIKRNPKDANLYYRLGVCLYVSVVRTNEVTVRANKAHIQFVSVCNQTLSCDSRENKVTIRELKDSEAALRKDFEMQLDRAIDAFATSVAISDLPENAAARTELVKLYRARNGGSENPLSGLDELIARKKKAIAREEGQ